MKFFKVSDELFINLEHVTNVWTREGRAEIERFCKAIDISFDHSFCE